MFEHRLYTHDPELKQKIYDAMERSQRKADEKRKLKKQMTSLEQQCREHFNEPIIYHNRVGRLVGYRKTKEREYYLVKGIGNYEFTYGVERLIFLNILKNQNVDSSSTKDDVWDDFSRIDLELRWDCPKEKEFIVEDETK